ncbi:MAG: hypothetical protein OES46_20810, partial [Gammaproteobacteria bacterium]|nr:hypothetical protein [Gammaproteobacteria bacterium]
MNGVAQHCITELFYSADKTGQLLILLIPSYPKFEQLVGNLDVRFGSQAESITRKARPAALAAKAEIIQRPGRPTQCGQKRSFGNRA